MKAVDVLSAGWLTLTLAAVAWSGARSATTEEARGKSAQSAIAASATFATLADGTTGVIDANGVVVPIRHYERIASGSTTADAILLALLEPERIAALTDYGKKNSDTPYQYGARFSVIGLEQLEPLVEQRIDLIVTNHIRSHAELARIREAGLPVFNLGEMRGLLTLVPNIHAIAALVGEPERGRRYAEQFARRMRMVADDIPRERRKRAVYVTAYANQLLGGARNTSYHDVLEQAGLIDAAASAYSGWVHYDPEQILELDPDIVVSNDGTSEALCQVAGLHALRACQSGASGVVTLPAGLLGDPGPRMLDAAELLRVKVYGEPK